MESTTLEPFSQKCLDAGDLAESTAMKVVVSIKIAINLLSSTALLFTFVSLKQSRSYRIVHKNVRLTLNFHIFYIFLANIFMIISNIIDLQRLSVKHVNPCGYLLPLWVTFSVRETYMFGVLGQTFTFVILSIERIMATFLRTYEHLQSKNLIVSLIIFKTTLCFFLVYFYIGFDADWTERTVQFYPQIEQNKDRIRIFTYIIVCCAFVSIVAYHVTYFLNSRGINRISVFDQKRVSQICKTLSEKYQIDENRKVIEVMLPMAWVHFLLYFGAYGSYIIILKMRQISDTEDAILSEALGLITFYAPIFAVYVRWQFSIKPKKDAEKLTDRIYAEGKSDYFKQMNVLFEVAPKEIAVTSRHWRTWICFKK